MAGVRAFPKNGFGWPVLFRSFGKGPVYQQRSHLRLGFALPSSRNVRVTQTPWDKLFDSPISTSPIPRS